MKKSKAMKIINDARVCGYLKVLSEESQPDPVGKPLKTEFQIAETRALTVEYDDFSRDVYYPGTKVTVTDFQEESGNVIGLSFEVRDLKGNSSTCSTDTSAIKNLRFYTAHYKLMPIPQTFTAICVANAQVGATEDRTNLLFSEVTKIQWGSQRE